MSVCSILSLIHFDKGYAAYTISVPYNNTVLQKFVCQETSFGCILHVVFMSVKAFFIINFMHVSNFDVRPYYTTEENSHNVCEMIVYEVISIAFLNDIPCAAFDMFVI